jgi:hypothetical protein
MRRRLALLALSLASSTGAAQGRVRSPNAVASENVVAISHVGVVNVERGVAIPDQTVVVQGARIVTVGPSRTTRVPAGSRVVDGRGRYVMPALWDMATWTLDYRACNPAVFPLLVAHGVLGVRDHGTRLPLQAIRPLKDSIARGLLLGPRLVVAGRSLATPDSAWTGRMRTVAEIDRAVDSLAAAGADYIRFRQYLLPELLPAVVRAAQRHHLPVTGAVVFGYARAAESGVRGIDHPADLSRSTSFARHGYAAAYARGTPQGLDAAFREEFARLPASARRPGDSTFASGDQAYAYFAHLRETRDTAFYRATLATLASRRTWITTNLSDFSWSLPRFELFDPLRARWRTHAQNVAMYRRAGENRRLWDYEATAAQRAGMLTTLRDLHRAGVPLLAGTQLDCGAGNTPGLSLHDELEWLTDAGLTPAEALRAATLEPARFLGASDSLGTIARGKVADLVLLDGDPLASITNTRRISTVVRNGDVLDRAALDALLAVAERAARAIH